jgi:hypothetical protein
VTPPLTIAHVARKPLEGTVAENALKYGTGSLNIDGTRIGTETRTNSSRPGQGNRKVLGPGEGGGGFIGGTSTETHNHGRWPANVILQHAVGCRRAGTKKVPSQNPQYKGKGKGKGVAGVYGEFTSGRPADVGIGYADADGLESVDAWECAPGCPVVELDEQSGVSTSSGGEPLEGERNRHGIYGSSHYQRTGHGVGKGDSGGASRFFKQVQAPPKELLVTSTPALTIIHLARKPLAGTVAENALVFGTGSLNIDGTRLDKGEALSGGGGGLWSHQRERHREPVPPSVNTHGRWPANVILQHAAGCRRAGTKTVRSSGVSGDIGGGSFGLLNDDGWVPLARPSSRPWQTEDGLESVDAWDCVPGCPVAELDEQSGERRSAGLYPTTRESDRSGNPTSFQGKQGQLYGDAGGASRFFKQVQASPRQEELLVTSAPPLTIIHLARKPLAGTVAENALKFGTGSLNIDGCRLMVPGGSPSQKRREIARRTGVVPNLSNSEDDGKMERRGSGDTYLVDKAGEQLGRWPANVILEHDSRCRRAGTKRVKGSHSTTGAWGSPGNTPIFAGGWADNDKSLGYVDAEGNETVDAWDCVPGCPVADLDEQSGVSLSSGGRLAKIRTDSSSHIYESRSFGRDLDPAAVRGDPGFGDFGGASRFFKQVQSPSLRQEERLVTSTPALTIIHLARRPLAGTVAENALTHGTGSLNIDGCRIGSESTLRPQSPQDNGQSMRDGTWQGGVCGSTKGRWPANVILQHKPGCELTGSHHEDVPVQLYEDGAENFSFYKAEGGEESVVRTVEGGQEVEEWACEPGCPAVDLNKQTGVLTSGVGTVKKESASDTGGNRGSSYGAENRPAGTPMVYYGDSGGAARYFKQVTEEWACEPGCAVADLGKQSGDTSSQVTRSDPGAKIAPTPYFGLGRYSRRDRVEHLGEKGTAARYFKQAPGTDATTHSHDLIEYLRTMISTPRQSAFVIDTEHFPESGWKDGSFCGFVVIGEVTQDQVDELWRLLPPGGHVIRIAPDTQPTGHSGAILLEDKGFEIRDAILLVRGPGRFHYVAKAPRKEREAGCDHLKPKAGHEAVDREEGSAGVNNPRAGAGRTAKQVRNFHPTVKPVDTMVRLLSDVPTDIGPVCDPFLGSGTTGIACVKTGHDFVGIEREADYLPISDARIRYWDRASGRWKGAVIESDYKREKKKPKPLTIDDLFG